MYLFWMRLVVEQSRKLKSFCANRAFLKERRARRPGVMNWPWTVMKKIFFFLKAKQYQGKGLQKSSVSGGSSIEFLDPGCLPGGPLVISTFFQQGRRRNWQQPSRQAVAEAGEPDALPPCSLPLLRPKSQRVKLLNFSIFVLQCSWSDPAGNLRNEIMPGSHQSQCVRTKGFLIIEGQECARHAVKYHYTFVQKSKITLLYRKLM